MFQKVKDIINKYWVVKIILIIALSLAAAFAVEAGCNGVTKSRIAKYDKEPVLEGIAGENIFSEEYRDKNANQEGILYTLEIPEQYIYKFQYKFHEQFNFSNHIVFEVKNGYGEWEEVDSNDFCNFNQEFSSIYVGRVVRKITIATPAAVKLSEFAINNVITMNKYRILLIAVILCLLFMLFSFKKFFSRHIEYSFAMIALAVGILILALSSTQFLSWDEHFHFQRTFDFYKEAVSGYTGSEWYQSEFPEDMVRKPAVTREEKAAMIQYLNDSENTIIQENYEPGGKGVFDIGYIFMATVVKISQMLGAPFYLQLLLGKFTNLLMYVLIVFFAIKILPVGKRFLMAVGLMPTIMVLSTSYSYDPFVVAFTVLGLALLVREFFTPEEKIKASTVIGIILCFTLGSAPKAIYVPLVLSILALPQSKFRNKKTKYIVFGCTLLACILMVLTFILPAAGGSGGDSRGGDTSVARQIVCVLSHPIAYMKILIHEIWNTFDQNALGMNNFANMAYQGINKFAGGLAILIFGVAFTEPRPRMLNSEKKLLNRYKVVGTVLVLGVTALVWTAMYMTFTPVGQTSIAGVQGRYYLPLTLPVYFLFYTDKFGARFKQKNYDMVIGLLLTFMWAATLYVSYLKVYCM